MTSASGCFKHAIYWNIANLKQVVYCIFTWFSIKHLRWSFLWKYNIGQKYIDPASNFLNNPLPFHLFTMLAQGVFFWLRMNKNNIVWVEKEMSTDILSNIVWIFQDFIILVCHVIRRVNCYLFVSLWWGTGICYVLPHFVLRYKFLFLIAWKRGWSS